MQDKVHRTGFWHFLTWILVQSWTIFLNCNLLKRTANSHCLGSRTYFEICEKLIVIMRHMNNLDASTLRIHLSAASVSTEVYFNFSLINVVFCLLQQAWVLQVGTRLEDRRVQRRTLVAQVVVEEETALLRSLFEHLSNTVFAQRWRGSEFVASLPEESVQCKTTLHPACILSNQSRMLHNEMSWILARLRSAEEFGYGVNMNVFVSAQCWSHEHSKSSGWNRFHTSRMCELFCMFVDPQLLSPLQTILVIVNIVWSLR